MNNCNSVTKFFTVVEEFMSEDLSNSVRTELMLSVMPFN